MNRFLLVSGVMLLSGCASIISGTKQEIAIDSVPTGANCNVTRKGVNVAQVTTPASTIVQKTKYDLLVSCMKPGYQTASVMSVSGVDPWVFGNLLAGGVIGLIVDFSTGAQNQYASPVVATLPPNLPPIADGASGLPAS